MAEQSLTEAPEKLGPLTWLNLSLGRWIALISALSVYAVHLTGKTIHEVYLEKFGIDPNLFPRSLDDIATLGQIGLIDRLTVVLGLLVKQLEAKGMWIWFAGSLIFFFIYCANRFFPKRSSKQKYFPRLVWWLRDAIKSVGLMAFVMFCLVYAYVLWVLLLLLPVALGQSFADERHKHDVELFNKGCQTSANRHCVQLLKSDKLITEGFVIDSSTTHIALYDVKTKQSRAMERVGTELRVVP